jgi:hypothetical protein
MGYSENCCQLCAVSINIARLRTEDEPASAGWGYSSGPYYSGDVISSRCSVLKEQSGCENIDKDEDEDGPESTHLPGRGCTFTGGYNGWKISAEEMKVGSFLSSLSSRLFFLMFEDPLEYFMSNQYLTILRG